MCIALLADRYMRLELMTEHIFLSTQEGHLRRREVYDIFFFVSEPWENARVLCVSEHNLLSHGVLAARLSQVPGAGGADDVFYTDSLNFPAEYRAEDHLFEIRLPRAQGERTPVTEVLAGKVLVPAVGLPERISYAQEVLELMEECGTVFELALGNLEEGMTYMFRLTIEPATLLGLTGPRAQRGEAWGEEISSRWVQDMTLFCPKTCLFNYMRMLSESRKVTEYAEAAGLIQSVVGDVKMIQTPVDRHLIVVIAPLGAELTRISTEGAVWAVAMHTLRDGRLAAVFEGGARNYWMDDAELVARHVYGYLAKWAQQEPKTKEDVSVAIGMPHENCSLVVDMLSRVGVLENLGYNRYRVAKLADDQREHVFAMVASSEMTRQGFHWRGFVIRLALAYSYLDPKARKLLRATRRKLQLGVWLGVTAVLMALPSFVKFLIEVMRSLLDHALR